MRIAVFVAFTGLLVSGCSSLPRPLPIPDQVPEEAKNRPLPFDNMESFETAQKKLEDHYRIYRYEAQSKRLTLQNTRETSFYSSVLAAIAGVMGAKNAAIAGATGAAGSSMYSSHYALEVQATNFENAAEALACVRLAGRGITDYGLRKSKVKVGEAMSPARPVALDAVSAAFHQIFTNLEKAQTKVTLATPDLSALKKALGAAPSSTDQSLSPESASPESASSAPKPFALGTKKFADEESKRQQLEQQDTQEAMKTYVSKVDACVAKFGS